MAPYTILSATDSLPLCISMLMKRAVVALPCLGSGRTERCGVLPLRDMMCSSGLRALGAVLGTRLLALGDAGGVERAAHGVVTHARQVLDATAADQHHAVLLQVVALAADVRDHLVAIGQAHLGHLAKGRVRLLRGGGVHAGAHAAALRAVGQRRRRALVDDLAARLAHQLVDRCHRSERFLGFGACALVNMTAGGGAPCLPRRKSLARADGSRHRKPCPDPPPRWPRPGAKALFRPSWAGHEALPAPHSEIWAGPGARRDVTASVAGGF